MSRDEGRSINFLLGAYPPNPLSLEIVLPRDFTGLLKTEAVYNAWDPRIDSGGRPVSDDYVLRVSKVIELD